MKLKFAPGSSARAVFLNILFAAVLLFAVELYIIERGTWSSLAGRSQLDLRRRELPCVPATSTGDVSTFPGG
jgi:hypothetical protein